MSVTKNIIKSSLHNSTISQEASTKTKSLIQRLELQRDLYCLRSLLGIYLDNKIGKIKKDEERIADDDLELGSSAPESNIREFVYFYGYSNEFYDLRCFLRGVN